MENPKVRPLEAFPVEMQGKRLVALRDPSQMVERMMIIPEEMLFVVQRLDGRSSVRDIQADYMRARGELLYHEHIEEVIRGLDENCLLDNERFRIYRQGMMEEFKRAEVRRAAHAGKGYDADPKKLTELFLGFMAQAGEGRSEQLARPSLTGLVAPHIDIRAGGRCFAKAYQKVAEESQADTFVIFGTSHAGKELFSLTRKSFETPLGIVLTSSSFVDDIVEGTRGDLFVDEFAHKAEHSIEFQVLWLQHARSSPFEIVPILCGGFPPLADSGRLPSELPEVREMIHVLRKAVSAREGRVILIAGADLAHVGPRYGDPNRVNGAILNWIEREDARLCESIERVDAEGFYRRVIEDGDKRRICGLSPIYMLLKVLAQGRGKKLGYDIWLDESTSSAVSFLSAEIRSGGSAG